MLTPAAHALIHDLATAGVMAETATTAHPWIIEKHKEIQNFTQVLPAPIPPVAMVPSRVPAVAAVARGEPGGVVVVSNQVIDEQGENLLMRMLAAVDLAALPRALVSGETGLADCINSLNPKCILVMGQAAVGALCGRTLGVEEWQAAPVPLVTGFVGPLGVTYPIEVLMIKPLMKKRAWQHLQRWLVAGAAA